MSSHPWLEFGRVDLSHAPWTLWILLGEAKAKCEQVALSLLKPTVGSRMRELYLAKGALATTAIEGNTLSEDQVQAHLEGKLKLPPSQEYLVQAIDNIVAACNEIAADVQNGAGDVFTVDKIKQFNRLVLRDLPLEDGIVAGEIRQHSVTVSRYRGAPAEDCEYLLQRLCEWLNGEAFTSPEGNGDEENRIIWAIVKAVMAQVYLLWIHPFGDGNGRCARLLEVQILLAAGVPTPAAHLLSNHYNLTRSEYYRELDAASREHHGNLIPFLLYAVQGFVDGLRQQLDLVWQQQFADRWEQFVYESFGHTTSPTEIRRRRLVLDLSKHTEPVVKRNLPFVSAEVAQAYAGKTAKTLTRDVNALIQMGLIERVSVGFRPRTQQILAFYPHGSSDPSPRSGSEAMRYV